VVPADTRKHACSAEGSACAGHRKVLDFEEDCGFLSEADSDPWARHEGSIWVDHAMIYHVSPPGCAAGRPL